MKLWQDLFGTDYGLMSIAGIIFMIFMISPQFSIVSHESLSQI